MSKKTKIILAIVILLVITGIVGFLFFYKNQKGERGIDVVRNAFPFGQGEEGKAIVPPKTGEEGERPPAGGEAPIQKLFQIHRAAIAGAYPFVRVASNEQEETVIRYMERGVGHIFETSMNTMREERISNTTRLKIYEALWGESGKNTIIRYLDENDGQTIRSFLLKLGGLNQGTASGEATTTVVQEETGTFLPENISSIAISSDGRSAFSLLRVGNEAVGTIYDMTTERTKQIFQSPLTEWLVAWPEKDTITLTTKPSGGVPGSMYTLDTRIGSTKKVLGEIDGLTTLANSDMGRVLYSKNTNRGFELYVYDTKSRAAQKLPFSTLPEKCVWGRKDTAVVYCGVPTATPPMLYPDNWYQGLISFSDEIWMMNTNTFTTELIANPMQVAREEIDVAYPLLSPDENFLFFTNKKDSSLWGARL